MRIAYFITGLGLGGAEIVTIGIANDMVRRGHDVMIAYLTGDNEYGAIIDPAIEVVGLSMSKTPWGMAAAMGRARKTLKQFAPDVVHANMVHANVFARLLRMTCNMPYLICTEHNKNIGGGMRMRVYRVTDRLSDMNTNVSQEATDHFIAQGAFKAKKSIAMYNGIDLSRFTANSGARTEIRSQYGIADDEFLWINVGRLTEAKDQSNLLRAFAAVGVGKLMIVGKGELLGVLEQQAQELKIANNVIFAGAHSNMPDYYSAADCFVLSSAWEGFGIVLAEAMACNLPVITTDAGGCAEVVDDQNWVVEVRNNDALSARMNEIYNLTQVERVELGVKNRAKTIRFDIKTVCDKWDAIYEKLVLRLPLV